MKYHVIDLTESDKIVIGIIEYDVMINEGDTITLHNPRITHG